MTPIDLALYSHKILLQEESYTIVKFDGLPKEVTSFLREIHWGSEGAIYQNMDTEKVFNAIPNPFLVAILEGDLIIATGVFCKTKINITDDVFPCYYIRFFAASPKIRGKGITKKYTSRIMELIAEEVSEKTIFFANIEKGNKASFNVVKNAGYDPMFTFNTIGFSRFFPQKVKEVIKISSNEEKVKVKKLLQDFYQGYAMVHFESLFKNDNYQVIKKNGEIVAGCQYYRVHWVISKMPGRSGMFILKVLPRLPFINRIFNPSKFEFIAFDSVYLKQGHEKELGRLFEHILRVENLHSGMLWLGSTSLLKKAIQQNMNLGILQYFVADSSVACMVRTENLTTNEKLKLSSAPVYAQALDFI